MNGGALTGTGSLVRLVVRRDRIRTPAWLAVQVLLAYAIASSYKTLYPTERSRLHFAALLTGNPALRAVYGPGHNMGTLGGLSAWRFVTLGAVLAGLMSLLMVVRHTRAEEEVGRRELVGAAVVGRQAPLAAALLVAVGANALLAVLILVGMVALGLPAAGGLALGLAVGADGTVFAAVAAVAAQLSQSARTAGGLAVAVLAAAFLLRAAADSAGGLSWLSWLSPVGWAQQVRAYAGEHWWVLTLPAAFVAVLAAAAFALAARRDMGAGLFAQRPGPARGAPGLRSPLALAWRLQRGTLFAWAAGMTVMAAAVASLAGSVDDLVDGNRQITDLINRMGGQHSIQDAFLATFMGLFGVFTAVYAVQATVRLRSEETAMRSEPLLAAGVGRTRWVASHLAFAVAGTAFLLAASGAATGLVHGARTGDVGGQVPRLLAAALVQLPAVWTLAGIGVALFGLAPRAVAASWALVLGFLLLGEFGPLLELDQWVMDVSPFAHVPKLPGGQVALAPLLVLAGLAAALVATGLTGFRRRDVG